jgi:hypothetical protein
MIYIMSQSYIRRGTTETDLDADFKLLNLDGNAVLSTLSNLDDIADVDAAAPSDGQVLTWVNASSAWEAVTPAAGEAGSQAFLMSCAGRTVSDPPVFSGADATLSASPTNWTGLLFTNNLSDTSSAGSLSILVATGNSMQCPSSAGARAVKLHAKLQVDIPNGIDVYIGIEKFDTAGAVLTQSIVYVPSWTIDRRAVNIETNAIFTTNGVDNTTFQILYYHNAASALNVFSPQISGELLD